jgi:flagellar M-ring protein FliF
VENLLNTLRALGPTRIATLAVALVVLLVLFSAVITRVSEAPMALLYGGMEQQTASKAAAFLDSQNVQYEIRGTGAIYVPQDRVGELRLKVAGEGLVGGSISGYEIFDKTSSFGTTSLVQNINARRALEGELARTIKSLPIVQNARVHLVMPKKRLFSKEKVVPTASVTLNVGGRMVDESTASSISHLVAAAVPSLDVKHVTIVDQRGKLLSSGAGSDGGASSAIDANSRIREGIESEFESSIAAMLERVAGNGKVSVSVNADIDFDRIEETSEIFDPDQQVVRSEQRSESSNTSQQSNGEAAVGVSGNVPGAGTTGSTIGSRENGTTTEETINYEISKKARHYIKESGGINKLSVAVLVEGKYNMVMPEVPEGEDPESVQLVKGEYIPYSPEELAKFETLVKTAIGYDETRGDSVEVIDMQFTDVVTEEMKIPLFSKEDYFRLGELAMMFAGMFFILLFIIRPLMKAATKAMNAQQDAENAAILQGGEPLAVDLDGNPVAAGTVGAKVTGGGKELGGASPTVGGESNDLIDVASVDGKVRASSLKKVAELVDAHPEESIGVIRSWMNSDNLAEQEDA